MTLTQLRNLAYGLLTLKQTYGMRRLADYLTHGVGLRLLLPADLPTNQTVLVLAPHADDEVFGPGGTLAALNHRHNKIQVLYLTDGANGTPDGHRDQNLVKTRQAEATAGLEALGGGQTIFWDYPDGSVRPTSERTQALVALLDQLKPSRIFVPWESDSHPDHQFAFLLLVAALQQAKLPAASEIWQYEVWAPLLPNRVVDISSTLKQKEQAIEAHQSQLSSRRYRDGILALNTYRGAFMNTAGPAEAFFALPVKQFLDFTQEKR